MVSAHQSHPTLTSQLTYPYIVIRYSQNALRRLPICFIKKEDKEFVSPNSQGLVIAVPDDMMDDSDSFDVSRELIVNCARMHVLDQRHPLCVIFDENDCVYVEHDGSVQASDMPPSHNDRYNM